MIPEDLGCVETSVITGPSVITERPKGLGRR
jgi:hypothetical protein